MGKPSNTIQASPTLAPGAGMKEMIDAVWKLPRDLVSDGYDLALEALSTQVPLKVHRYPSGTKCFTWTVPPKWTCRDAYLETLEGEKIFSLSDNPLHAMSYSQPINKVVEHDELLRHLHVHSLEEAIPFRYAYYNKNWGLCCTSAQMERLREKRYKICIDTLFESGELKVGEAVCPGKTKQTVVLCAHLCHPAMVNDGLSGVVAGIDVIRRLLDGPTPHFTYRLLILPETIGSAAYLSHNQELIPDMVGGLFLEMLGTPLPHSLQLSYDGKSIVDRAAKVVLSEHDHGSWWDKFLTLVCNDERMFNAPGIRVPMASLSRTHPRGHPEWPYREYHTSLDDPDSIDMQRLEDSRDMVLRILEALENDWLPVPRFVGEVFFSGCSDIDYVSDHELLFKIMFHLDGRHSALDIAEREQLPLDEVKRVLKIFSANGLIEPLLTDDPT